jgi:hypothetical protein
LVFFGFGSDAGVLGATEMTIAPGENNTTVAVFGCLPGENWMHTPYTGENNYTILRTGTTCYNPSLYTKRRPAIQKHKKHKEHKEHNLLQKTENLNSKN